MATAAHVNGTAQIKVGLGTGGALQLLGHSVEGVHINFFEIENPVYTDAGGGSGGIEASVQTFGEIAVISADVVIYDEVVLYNVRGGSERLVEGQMIPAGTVLDAVPPGGVGNKGYYRLLIDSPGDGLPYNFPTARRFGQAIQLSTKVNIWRLTWRAIPFFGSLNTMNGAVLYNRVGG